MDRLEQFTNWLQGHLAYIQTTAFWIQVIAIIIAAIIARIFHKFWLQHSTRLLTTEQLRIKQLGLKSTNRIVFPLSMLLILVLLNYLIKLAGLDTALLRIAFPLLISLAAIRFIVYALRKVFKPSSLLKAWENVISITIWLVVALHLLGWLPELINYLDSFALKLGNIKISALSVIQVMLFIGIFMIAAMSISNLIERRISASEHLDRNMKLIMLKIIKPILIVLAIVIALDAVGIDLTAFTVFGGALGVGLGFGLQRIASNFISGFILIFDKSIKPGDVISLGQSFGWVQELHARYVVIKDRDGVETLIPNENLITTQVINWSYSDRKIRIKIPVQISYRDDPEQAIALMVEAANISTRVLQDPAPVCRLMEFGDNGITLELRIWINDPENGVSNIRTDIYLEIWKTFKDNHITIPYPQRDLHLKSSDVTLGS